MNRHAFSVTQAMQMAIVCFLVLFPFRSTSFSARPPVERVGAPGRGVSTQSIVSIASGGSPVSPYTGQISESFPLLSMPTNGMGDIGITLTYGGNVSQAAVAENRFVQASFVGLGFSLGQEAIVADHGTTYERWDDTYYHVDPSGAMTQLIYSHTQSNPQLSRVFRVGNGASWRVYEYLNEDYLTPDTHRILNWTIVKEDGLEYTYSPSGSALCWNKHYGVHTTNSGKSVPVRWNLSRVRRGSTSVTFTPMEELDSLKIPSGYNSYKYTRTTYPSSITAYSGSTELTKATFYYSQRQDLQSNHAGGDYEFYQAKKLDSILVLASGTTVIKRIRFGYSYLNSTRDSVFKKLLLQKITTTNGDGTDSLAPIRFEYYETDSLSGHFGSLKKIYYPDGGKREFVYTTVPADSMITTLHNASTRLMPFSNNTQWYKYSREIVAHKFRNVGDTAWRYELTAWNGMWQKYLIPDVYDTDSYGDTGNFDVFGNTVYLYYQRINKVIRFQFLGGLWQRDTIQAHFTAFNGAVGLTAGSNKFLLAHYPAGNFGTTSISDPKYYVLDSVWRSLSLTNLPYGGASFSAERAYLSVSLGNDVHGMKFLKASSSQEVNEDSSSTCIYYWAYDYVTKSLVYKIGQDRKQIQYFLGNNYGVSATRWWHGTAGSSAREIVYLEGSALRADTITDSREFRQLAPIADGFLYLTQHIDGQGNGALGTVNKTGSPYPSDWGSVGTQTLAWNHDDFNMIGPSGENRFLFYHQPYNNSDVMELDVYRWAGNGWEITPMLSGMSADAELGKVGITSWVAGDLFVAVDQEWDLINVKLHKGNGNWTSTFQLGGKDRFRFDYDEGWIGGWGPSPSPDCRRYAYGASIPIACGRDFIVHNAGDFLFDSGGVSGGVLTTYDDRRKLYRFDPFLNKWDTLNLGQYLPNCSTAYCKEEFYYDAGPDEMEPIAYAGRFFVPTPFYGLSAFQAYRNTYFGKPAVSVVSRVLTYPEGDATTNPVVVKYSYAGGLLDAGSNAPRFCKTSQSLPYLLNDSVTGPDGWTITYFYNDIDSGTTNMAGIRMPDMDAPHLGFEGAGYLLDGLPYISYDSSRGDGPTTCFDSVVNYYRVVIDNSLGASNKMFRPQLVRMHARSQKVPSDVAYSYDLYGRKTASRTWVQPGITKVDTVTYAAFVDSLTVGISLSPALEMSYLKDSVSGMIQWLSRSHTEWENRLERKKTRLARDAADTTTYFTTYERLTDGIDGFGNIISTRGIDCDTSGFKYSPNGNRKVASIEKGFVKNVAVFDAEYGLTFDSWQQTGNPALSSTSTEQVCTGLKSLKIQDDAGSTAANAVLQRTFVGSVLKRSKYVISFWQRSSNSVKAKLTLQPSGAVFSVNSTGNGNWKKQVGVFDLSSYSGITSAALSIETSNLNGDISYVDDIRFHPLDAIVTTSTYDPLTGLLLSTSDPTNEPVRFEYDSFQREVRTKDVKGRLITEKSFYQSVRDPQNSYAYNPSKPNYVIAKSFRTTGVDSVVAVTFSDGLGNPLQSRSLVRESGATRTLVGGYSWSDARGRATRTFKPWIDRYGSSGLLDYSDSATSLSEVNQYYNGTYAPNHQGFTYAEAKFENTIKGRPLLTGGFGGARQIDSGHAIRYGYAVAVAGADTIFDGWTYDQDSVLKVGRAEARGRWSKQISINRNGTSDPDSVAMVTYPDIMNQSQIVKIDTGNGTAQITLNRSWSNDLGLSDSSWQVDYGSTYALYDNKGNPRFSRNEKQRASNQFTYVKYDMLGRKIEEGLILDSTKWKQDSASSCTFPSPSDPVSKSVTYKWHYDFYVSGSDTLLQPGKLVRVDNSTGTYYRHFYYFPDRDVDSQVIKLPIANGTLKAIKREYNQDGSVKRLSIYPRLGQSAGYRVIEYQYDVSGRPLALHKPFDPEVSSDTLRYVTYDYNPDGSLRTSTLGYSKRQSGMTTVRDSLQILNFEYDLAGSLVKINDSSTVLSSLNGGPFQSLQVDHFGENLTYYSPSEGYYNGRALSATTFNSAGSSVLRHYWKYSYNDLGWILTANEGSQSGTTALDEVYTYNLLGQRKSMQVGTAAPVTLTYSTTTGSSRVTRISTMPAGMNMQYDILGNLTADSSRNLLNMKYDYRNLLTHVRMKAQFTASLVDSMSFTYDENGNRISKRYDYQYQNWCDTMTDPPGGGDFMMGGASGGGGSGGFDSGMDSLLGGSSIGIDSIGGGSGFDSLGVPGGGGGESSLAAGGGGGGALCTFQSFTEQFYLYDGGVLLATFDTKDSVVDLFINAPTGRIASYSQNNSASLQYYLSDHLGSARVMMTGAPGQAYTTSQYYNFSPWGATIESWGSYNTPYKFTGKEHDQHGYFKAHYFGARYYDDRLGMFTSVDPAGQFVSAYVYGGNNPIMGVDPDGRWFFEALGVALSVASLFVDPSGTLGMMILHASIGMNAISIVNMGQNGATPLQIVQAIGTSALGFAKIPGYQQLGISIGTGYAVSSDKKNYWKTAAVQVGTVLAGYGVAELRGKGSEWSKGFWKGAAKARGDNRSLEDHIDHISTQATSDIIHAQFASALEPMSVTDVIESTTKVYSEVRERVRSFFVKSSRLLHRMFDRLEKGLGKNNNTNATALDVSGTAMNPSLPGIGSDYGFTFVRPDNSSTFDAYIHAGAGLVAGGGVSISITRLTGYSSSFFGSMLNFQASPFLGVGVEGFYDFSGGTGYGITGSDNSALPDMPKWTKFLLPSVSVTAEIYLRLGSF